MSIKWCLSQLQINFKNIFFLLFYSEILTEERHCDTETMRRENRRVAAMSWGASDENAPPKPSRGPNMGMSIS